MKTKNRLLSIVVLAVTCFVMAIAFMAINVSGLSAKADSAEESFYIDGISLRTNVGSEGFRVETIVTETAKTAHGEGAEYGTLFLPQSYIDAGTALEFYGDGTLHQAIVDVPTKVWGDVGKTFYKSAIVGREDQGGTFPDSYLNKPITAVSYAKTESGVVYTAPVTRTIAYIAECAVTDGEELVEGSLVKRLIDFNKDNAEYKPQLKVDGESTTAITLDKGETASAELFLAGMPASTSSKVVVEFNSVDDAVASVDNNGTITANGKGSTTINATYKAGEGSTPKTVSVEVTVIDVFSVNAGPYGFKQGDLVIKDAKISGSNVVATYKDAELIGATISGDTVTIPASNFTAVDNAATISLETTEVKATVSVRIVDAVIRSAADFNNIVNWVTPNGTQYDGTFVLANDIDFAAEVESGAISSTVPATSSMSFRTLNFDGQGYMIKNISGALFGTNITWGTIQNLAVIDAKIGGWARVITLTLDAAILSNVFVAGVSTSTVRSCLLVDIIKTGATLRNVVVDGTGSWYMNNLSQTDQLIGRYLTAPTTNKLTNVYSIAGKTNGKIKHVVVGADNAAQTTLNVAGGYNFKADFLAANPGFWGNTMRITGTNLEMYNSALGQWRVVDALA